MGSIALRSGDERAEDRCGRGMEGVVTLEETTRGVLAKPSKPTAATETNVDVVFDHLIQRGFRYDSPVDLDYCGGRHRGGTAKCASISSYDC